MMWGYGMGNGWMVVWTIAALLGLALLILITVRMFSGGGFGTSDRPDRGYASPINGRSTARRILDERFARGELNAEAYREHLRILGEGN